MISDIDRAWHGVVEVDHSRWTPIEAFILLPLDLVSVFPLGVCL